MNDAKNKTKKVSVPLMMTVKAVVTFENFRSESIDPRNFIVPREYKRSRRMSKEKYMAGVAAAAKAVEEGRGAGTGGGGTPGALDSDDEEEEEDLEDEGVGEGEIEEVGGGALTAAEILRRRAASRNAFDDDEVGVWPILYCSIPILYCSILKSMWFGDLVGSVGSSYRCLGESCLREALGGGGRRFLLVVLGACRICWVGVG